MNKSKTDAEKLCSNCVDGNAPRNLKQCKDCFVLSKEGTHRKNWRPKEVRDAQPNYDWIIASQTKEDMGRQVEIKPV